MADSSIPDGYEVVSGPTAAPSGVPEGYEIAPPPQPSLMRRALTKAGQVAGEVGTGIRAGMDIASGAPAESSMTGKNMPSLEEGADPLAIASRHPYAVAAASGGALGPTIPFLAAISEANPLLSAGLGAAEQMGYQGIADVSNKIGQRTGHPILGAIPGIAAPFVAPSAIERGLGTKLMQDTIGSSVQKGHEAIQTVADAAATKQEAANLADQTKLSESAQAKLQDFNDKINAHANEIYSESEAARTAETAKAEKAGAKAQEEAVAAEKERLATEAEANRGQLLGRTRAETAAAVHPQPATPEPGVAVASEKELSRKHAFRQAIFGERERTADYLGKKLDAFEKAHGNADIPDAVPMKKTLEAVGSRLHEEAGEPMETSKGLQKLITQARKAAGLEQETQITPNVILKGTYATRSGDPLHAALEARIQAATGAAAAEGQGAKAGTVSYMRDVRRAAQKFAAGAATQSEKDIATDIAQAADESLEHATGVPKEDIESLRNTNKHWRDFRENYTKSFLSHVSNEPEPTKVAKDIFGVPKRALRLMQGASPEEGTIYRNLAADWVNEENVPLHEIPAKLGGDDVTRALGWDPDKLRQFDPKLAELNAKAQAPPVARDINAGFNARAADIISDHTDKLRRETIALARQLGPAGKQIETAMRNAMTPMDVQKVAGQLAQMTPQDFVKALAAQQPSGDIAATTAVGKLPLQHDAARQALLRLKPGATEGRLGRFAQFHSLFWLLREIGPLMSGTLGANSVIGITALNAAVYGIAGMRGAGRAILRDPKLFELAYKALTTPRTMSGYRATGTAIAEMMNGVAMINAKKKQEAADKAREAATAP